MDGSEDRTRRPYAGKIDSAPAKEGPSALDKALNILIPAAGASELSELPEPSIDKEVNLNSYPNSLASGPLGTGGISGVLKRDVDGLRGASTRDYIENREGVRPWAYKDSEGYWTVGTGQLVKHPDYKDGSLEALNASQYKDLERRVNGGIRAALHSTSPEDGRVMSDDELNESYQESLNEHIERAVRVSPWLEEAVPKFSKLYGKRGQDAAMELQKTILSSTYRGLWTSSKTAQRKAAVAFRKNTPEAWQSVMDEWLNSADWKRQYPKGSGQQRAAEGIKENRILDLHRALATMVRLAGGTPTISEKFKKYFPNGNYNHVEVVS